MSTNVPLDEALSVALRVQAETEGLSPEALATRILREYLGARGHRLGVAASAREEAARWRELLERLH
jgi:plasmid stability protein